ncbi:MAG TPA: flagellar biosynthesis regulator FlaF [Burkholderiales bacterium]|nr:flagellar biosynthesis regulator FlaF [Burkholderiales bacterium]
MYRRSYSEEVTGSGMESRAREREAFEQVIELLQIASKDGSGSKACINALFFLRGLWLILLEDIASPENALPQDLRRRLGSIGLWMLNRAEDIRQGRSHDIEGLIEINAIIRDGLK